MNSGVNKVHKVLFLMMMKHRKKKGVGLQRLPISKKLNHQYERITLERLREISL